MKNNYLLLSILSLLLLCLNIYAEENTSVYTISLHDEIIIEIWGKSDLTREITVRNDGNISFPPIGDIKAAGKTPSQLSQDLAHGLISYLDKPQVTVTIKKSHGTKITILGGVNKSGEFFLIEDATILEAIGIADGLNILADETQDIKIIRKEKTINISLSSLIKGERKDDNIILKKNDIVIIPENLEKFLEKFKDTKANINIWINNKKTEIQQIPQIIQQIPQIIQIPIQRQ